MATTFFRRAAIVCGSAMAFALIPWTNARAGMADIRAADNALSIGVGTHYMDYREDNGRGGTLDSERGWMPEIRVGDSILASGAARGIFHNLYLHADASLTFGQTHYEGALLDGTPYAATTNDLAWRAAGRIGRGYEIAPDAMLIPYAEVGYRHWRRSLTYTETYTNWSVLGGLIGQYSPAPKWVGSLSAAVGTTFGADMYATAPFNETFSLGDALTWRVGGEVGYAVTPELEERISVETTRLGFGASAADANGYYEPNSTTTDTTLMLGTAFHFF